MMRLIFLMFLVFLAFGASVSPSISDPRAFLLKMEGNLSGVDGSEKMIQGSSLSLMYKGGITFVTGWAILLVNALGQLDVSPIVWGLLFLFFLPIPHFIAIIWGILEKLKILKEEKYVQESAF